MRFTFAASMLLAVSLPSSALAQATPPVATLTPELRIDGTTENLSTINSVGVSPKGLVAILQPQDNKILFYNAAGIRVGSFGRSGEGPGEFRNIGFPGWVGDTLRVSDPTLRRTTYVSPEFKLVRSVPDRPATTLPEAPVCEQRLANGSVRNPHCARTVRGAAPDSSHLVVVSQSNPKSSTATFTVAVTRRNGDKVFARSVTTPSAPIPQSFTDSLLQRMNRMNTEAQAFIRSSMPDFFPPVIGAFVGRDGTVWLMLSPVRGTHTFQYLVLPPNGATLATITLPRATLPQVVSRTTLWAVVTDADGVDSVVRYRVH